MRSSAPLYNRLAADYDAHFEVPHRRAYDDLSWEIVRAGLPPAPASLIDVGAGVGRWSERLIAMDYAMTGIEPADEMARHAARRLEGQAFALHPCRVENADLPAASFDGAFAMGSMQYSDDIRASVARIGGWLRPGAPLFILVDSALALALELIARGEPDVATDRIESGRGVWEQHGEAADLHLFDRTTLEAAFRDAGFTDIRSHGLLVGASALGREGLNRALAEDYAGRLAIERRLADVRGLVDVGKQILVAGRKA